MQLMSQNILTELQDGVTDVPIDKPGPESEVHLLHKVGPLPMQALNRAVTLMRSANEQVSTSTVETIDPRFVLIHAWSASRLEESKRLISKTFEKREDSIPGIHSVYMLGLPPYYVMSTGDAHDVVAARLLGMKEIRVKVGSYCNAHPNRLLVEGNRVYFWAAEYEEWREFGTESNETVKILEALGVESKQTVVDRVKRLFTHSG
jgi:hypothetical protein